MFNIESDIRLDYTPRKILSHPESHNLFILESESVVVNNTTHWKSCIRIINPITFLVIDHLSFDTNEAALSICIIDFDQKGVFYLVVGLVKDYVISPKSFSNASIATFRINDDNSLEPMHKTTLTDLPLSIGIMNDKLLVSCGSNPYTTSTSAAADCFLLFKSSRLL